MTTQPFQAEVRQLLDIVIHSLYTDREIFVRELVSNASDALEKLRHHQLTGAEVYQPDAATEISLTTDEENNTLTLIDTGIGLTRAELIENLGTIAHSGTRAFLDAIKENGGSTSGLIGKFGVGFYSVFMAAQEVKVFTHSYQPDAEPLVWSSDGATGYTIDDAPGQARGCRIVITLKEDAAEFAKPDRLRGILEKYSNFVPFPILLNGERVNTVEALWLKNKNEVTPEQYTEFYRFAGHAWDEPRFHLHFSADAPIQINALLFVPTENQEKWGVGQTEPGVALYCRRVLIDPKPQDFLPEWLRFLRGVVDSEDLPLNISRESMQDSALVRKLGDVIVRRLIKQLETEGAENAEKYEAFYRDFSRFIKEGIASDNRNRDLLPKLLRYESSLNDAGKLTSLPDYVTRMKEGQTEIYYQIAPNRSSIEGGPYLEAFKARDLEVLFLFEPLDDYVMTALREFDGRKFVSVDRAQIKLDDLPDATQPKGESLAEADTASLCTWLKETLGEGVSEVTTSSRLIDSPVLALQDEGAASPQFRQMMRAMNQEAPGVKVKLEINPRHPLIRNLSAAHAANPDLAKLVATQLLDNALLSAGLLDDPRDMVRRVNDIMAAALHK